MSQKPNRWIIQVVMVLALIAFVGFSILPLLSNVFKNNQVPSQAATPAPAQSPQQTQQSNKQSELEALARGYELVLQREPENKTALESLIKARLELNDIKGAIPPLEKLAKLNADEPRYTVLLAQAKQQAGDKEGAVQTYRSILNVKPGNIEALQGMVGLLLQENKPEAAIGLLQETMKNGPTLNKAQAGTVDVPAVQLMLGQVYSQQKRFAEAIAVYDELVKTKPDDFRPVLGKAIVLKMQGKSDDAKPLFAKASNLAPAQYKDQIQKMATEKSDSLPTPPSSGGNATPAPNSSAPKGVPTP